MTHRKAETRKCARCKKTKPVSDFAMRSNKKWLMPWCKQCKRNYDKIAVATKRAAILLQERGA